jgi:peptidoglycan hydrolase-like protein with peptidoglycan-binding domain
MAEQTKTTTRAVAARKDTVPVTAATRPTDATDRTDAPQRSAPTLPEPSPRNGVLVSIDSIRVAFVNGHASQAVGYVQHVLTARGFDPGTPTGIADQQTRTALARFQSSINEPPTGLPTDRTLDFLGFDLA